MICPCNALIAPHTVGGRSGSSMNFPSNALTMLIESLNHQVLVLTLRLIRAELDVKLALRSVTHAYGR